MKKVIVLSVNENPIYQFTLPLVVWSWVRLGWHPYIISIVKDDRPKTMWLVNKTISQITKSWSEMLLHPFDGYRTDTISQVSRLYASCSDSLNDCYVMSGDADMMGLSDYWQFDPKKITVWGHDLTDYQQMPICFIGMMAERWREVMGISSWEMTPLMKRDLDDMPDAGENGNQINRWCTDQRLITKRINEVQFEKEFINRGVLTNGYPVGRIDRSAWNTYHPQPIDCHLPHEIYTNDEIFAKVMRMLASVFPDKEFFWFAEYTEQFKQLVNG